LKGLLEIIMTHRFLLGLLTLTVVLAALVPALADDAVPARRPVRVTIHDDKPVVAEPVLPVDPMQHVVYQFGGPGRVGGLMDFGVMVDGKRLTFSPMGGIMTAFKIDEQILQPGAPPGRLEKGSLPARPGKNRIGQQATYTYNNMRIIQTVEVVPGRPTAKALPGQKQRLDVVLVRYFVENKDSRPHSFALRIFLDMLLVDNDGALFAAPNFPDKILDGIELKGKQVPDYLKVLQRPDLKNPMYVSHFTYALGRERERPDRVILTNLGGGFGNPWDIRVVPAMGDSAVGMFWDTRPLQPGGKRELAYSYGEGIASNPEPEGKIEVTFGGSFEPGKLFNITAYVQDPPPGQTLTLELPPGMERIEGKERQPVPSAAADGGSIVLWKARVHRMGEYALRIRSSTGLTQTRLITISRAE